MRMFVALFPPADAIEDLTEFLEPRREAEPDFRWTGPEQWHLTLAFLPDVADRSLDELEDRLGTAASRRTPVDLTLVGGGAFPDPARAKVLVAGVHSSDADELDRLAAGARAAAGKAGTTVDGGGFHPHVTLARTGRPVQVSRWLRVLDAYRGPTWPARELTLVASHLGEGPRRRPRYDVLATFPLGTGHPGPAAPGTGRGQGETGG